MKILLVVKSKMMENLGVMYISSVIKYSGHECKIVSLGEMVNTAIEWRPQIIGMSIMTGDRDKFKEVNSTYHNYCHYPGELPTTIVGGPDPTFFPEGYDWADEVVKGEAEAWAAEKFNSPLCIAGIDNIPWPSREDFPKFRVRDFITSRGCPYSCHYCFNEKWGELFPEYAGVRVRNVDDVIAEIKDVDPEYVYFQDSCFGVSMKWFVEFAKKMHKLKKPYQCNFRPEQITSERAYWLQYSRCAAVRMALETASYKLREMVGRKGYDCNDIRNASELLSKNGIMYMIQNIIELPTATIEDDIETLWLNIECDPTYSWVSIYQPYPGTALGDKCKAEGWYKGDYSDITDSFFDTSRLEFNPEHIEQLEILQKIFAMCVTYKYLPAPEELTYKNLPKLIHKITRLDGDKKLYLGVLCWGWHDISGWKNLKQYAAGTLENGDPFECEIEPDIFIDCYPRFFPNTWEKQ